MAKQPKRQTKRKTQNRRLNAVLTVLILLALLVVRLYQVTQPSDPSAGSQTQTLSLSDIPSFSGEPYVILYDNQPAFSEEDKNAGVFETYSDLDSLGRCGTAFANICLDLMPTENREGISQVKPSGWQSAKYDCVDGKYLYNRCHLIGFQLAGENANKKNLITGTRYLNVVGMLPFENQVADYVKETENHVLYRVTPVFHGEELVARGVQMEAWSIEDAGAGICFNIYAYNNQPGVVIDYATGGSSLEDAGTAPGADPNAAGTDNTAAAQAQYVLNTQSKRFHLPTCASAPSLDSANRGDYTGSREDLIAQNYVACGQCKP